MERITVLYAYLGFYRDSGGEHAPLGLAEELDRERFRFEVVTLMPATFTIGAAVQATGCPLHELGMGIPLCNLWARLAAKLARVPVVIATINFDEPPQRTAPGNMRIFICV